MKVLKFGGTSLGTPERMQHVAKIVLREEKAIVVLSAVSGTTNKLVEISQLLYADKRNEAKQAIINLHDTYKPYVDSLYSSEDKKKDGYKIVETHMSYIDSFTEDLFTSHEEKAILAQGELISTALFQNYLEELQVQSALISALDFMRIDKDLEPDSFYIKHNLSRELAPLQDKQIIVTQGYICRNAFGEIDNLKRGGSDYTATLVGLAIEADCIEIWTDIDGMHNNDPRVVDKTMSITHLSYDEAAELAYFGAKILHPASVYPAQLNNIPIKLKNTLSPDQEGTTIDGNPTNRKFTAVAAKDNITAVKIKSGRMLLAYGFLRKVFEIFERYKTPIDVITTSEVAVSLTIDDNTHINEIRDELRLLGQVEIQKDLSIVCVVGSFSQEEKGDGTILFKTLENIPIRMVSYGGSENNITFIMESKYKKQALMDLNKGLFNL